MKPTDAVSRGATREDFAGLATKFFADRPFRDPQVLNSLMDSLIESARPKHEYKNTGVTVFDKGECSCGWAGSDFWDGADLAFDEWVKHVLAEEQG